MEEGRSTDESEQEDFDTLEREVDLLDGDIKRYGALEKINRAKAVPVVANEVGTPQDGAAARGGYVQVKAPELPPGIRFARVAKCIAMAHGNLGDAARVAEQMYSHDQPIVNILKAAVAAGTTTDATWAGNLVSPEGAVFADFLEFFRPSNDSRKVWRWRRPVAEAGAIPSATRKSNRRNDRLLGW